MAACPSCKKRVSSSATSCPHCGASLARQDGDGDASVLDDGVFGTSQGQRDLSFGDDAVILGDGVEDFDAFDAVDTGFVQRELTNARIFVGGSTQNLLRPDAIPEKVPGASLDDHDLTPYELHVLQFVNGKRPVGRIRRKSGMEEPDVKLALAMLADKRLVRLAGHVSEDRKLAAREKRRAKLKAEKAKRRDGKERSSSRERVKPTDDARERPRASAPSREERRAARPPRAPTRVTREERPSRESLAALDEATRVTPPPPPPPAARDDDARPAAHEEQEARRAPHLRSLDVGLDDEGDDSGAFAGDTEVVAQAVPEPADDARARRDLALDDVARGDDARAAALDDAGAVGNLDHRERETRARDADAVDDEASGFDDEGAGSTAMLPSLASRSRPALESPRTDIHREVTLVRATPQDARDESRRDEGRRDDAPSAVDDAHDAPAVLSARDVVPLSTSGVGPVPVADELHDAPTGPVAVAADLPSAQHGRGFDDSVLPTGEVPSLSLSGFPDDGAGGTAPVVHALDDAGAPVAPAHVPHTDEAPETLEPGAIDVVSLPSEFFTPLPTPPPQALTPLPGAVVHAPPSAHEAARPTTAAPSSTPPVATPPVATPPIVTPPGSRTTLPPLPGPPPTLPGQAAARAVPRPKDDEEIADALADDSDEGEAQDQDSSKVSYENRKKAEKIFEQAERDAAAGRFASARMNAKLAMIYDPSTKRYKELYELWGSPAAQAAAAQTRKDVQLFQEAKDLELKGDYRGAVKLLEQALKLNPRAAPILNLLGVIQATRLREYRKASDNLMKACELEPGNRSFKNNLGKVLGMAEDARDKRVVDEDDGGAVKVKKMRPKLF